MGQAFKIAHFNISFDEEIPFKKGVTPGIHKADHGYDYIWFEKMIILD